MKIKKGWDKHYYAVFEDSEEADKWEWLFWDILRRVRCCYGQYDNAYQLW